MVGWSFMIIKGGQFNAPIGALVSNEFKGLSPAKQTDELDLMFPRLKLIFSETITLRIKLQED